MKKPYQIESQRAVKRLEELAADGNPAVQMLLPMAEMVGWLRKGVSRIAIDGSADAGRSPGTGGRTLIHNCGSGFHCEKCMRGFHCED